MCSFPCIVCKLANKKSRKLFIRDAAFHKKAAGSGARGLISFLVHKNQAAVPVSTTTSTSTLTKTATASSNGRITYLFSLNESGTRLI